VEMASCIACGKIFGATGNPVCPACRKLLDIVYEKARAYLRDNQKERLDAKALAKAIDEDVRLVEILVAEGRFDEGDAPRESDDERKRKRLLEDLQKNLSAPAARKEGGPATYASGRHGKNEG